MKKATFLYVLAFMLAMFICIPAVCYDAYYHQKPFLTLLLLGGFASETFYMFLRRKY